MEKPATLDSTYELYFSWWLDDLKEYGLVRNITPQPEGFSFDYDDVFLVEQNYQKKENIYKSFKLFNTLGYTPDFLVEFHKSLLHKLFGHIVKTGNTYILRNDPELEKGNVYQNTIFYCFDNCVRDDYYSIYFDVKPPSSVVNKVSFLASSRDFRYNQILLFDRHKIYVNKVVPIGMKNCLFNKTFTPKRYFYTDSGKILRKRTPKLTWRTIEQYLTDKQIKF